jgi:hypothetical protein
MGLTITGGIIFLGGIELISSSEPPTPPTPFQEPLVLQTFGIYPAGIGDLNSAQLAQVITFGDD